eukprot:gene1928-3615_t
MADDGPTPPVFPGQSRSMTQPYWRSVMGYMCELRAEVANHYGVAASFLGREGPDCSRASGITLLPPCRLVHVFQILLFLTPLHTAAADLTRGDQGTLYYV